MADDQDAQVITRFLKQVWKEESGYVHLAVRHPETLTWKQEFFEWPYEETKVVQFVLQRRASFEVYFAPSIFTERKTDKSAVKGAHVYWIEYDGKPSVHTTEVP